MTKTLEMVFRSEGGKEVTLSIADPKDNVTLAEVKVVMEDIIAKKVFQSKTGDFSQIVEARINSKDTAALV
jgi:C4-type Zn-finger protein